MAAPPGHHGLMPSRSTPPMTPRAEVGDQHVLSFMRLVGLITAANGDRPTNELDTRQRLVIQMLGLSGPLPLAVVAQRLGGISASTMTGTADRLESGGYVRREAGTDRRVAFLTLTAKGKRTFKGEVEFFRNLITQTVGALDDEASRLILQALLELNLNP